MDECPSFYKEFQDVANRAACQAEEVGKTLNQKLAEFKKLILQNATSHEVDLHYFICVGEKDNFEASWRHPSGKSYYKLFGDTEYIAVIYKCWSLAADTDKRERQETQEAQTQGIDE